MAEGAQADGYESPEADEEPDPDLMTPDNDPPLPFGADSAEPSDADMEKATEAKMAAADAASNGDHAKAIEHFTTALTLMPSPLVYAKRAECLLKLKKPNAAIRDCGWSLPANHSWRASFRNAQARASTQPRANTQLME